MNVHDTRTPKQKNMEQQQQISEQEYRALMAHSENNDAENFRALSDINDKQINAVAGLLKDYDEQTLKYMIFSAQTCIALASVPENMQEQKTTAIEFIADLYRALDGCY